MKKFIIFLTFIFLLFNTAFAYENSFDTLDGINLSNGSASIKNGALCVTVEGKTDINISVPSIKSGKIEISYKLQFADNKNTVIYLPAPSSDGKRVINPQLHQKTFAFPNNDQTKHIGTYSENTWHTVRIVADTESMNYDVYINEVLKCSSLKMSYVLTRDIDGINISLSSGMIMLDDLKIEKIGDGGQKTILFNSEYHVDHTAKTIGLLPLGMKTDDFLKTISLKNDCDAFLSSQNGYISDGDILTVCDNLYGNSYSYTLNVRTLNISAKMMGQFSQSLILKENEALCYVKGTPIYGQLYQNGLVSKEILNIFGINTAADKSLAELNEMGYHVQSLFGGYAVIRKLPLNNTKLWYHDLQKLFGGGVLN